MLLLFVGVLYRGYRGYAKTRKESNADQQDNLTKAWRGPVIIVQRTILR